MTAPTNISNSQIYAYAESIGRHHNLYTSKGLIDVHKLVTVLGGTYSRSSSRTCINVRGAGDFTIFVPLLMSSRRQRYLIAHALGHYFLHYRIANKEEEMSISCTQDKRAEVEANVFAAGLLMPRKEFTQSWSSSRDALLVSEQFEVSPNSVAVRAKVLNLVN